MTEDHLVKVGIALTSFVCGALLSRFTMSKKERFDVNAKKQETSNVLESEVTAAYQLYIDALAKFTNSTKTTFDDFIEIEKAGAVYFQTLNSLACSVLSSNTEKESVKNSHVQKIKDGYVKVIPQHYQTLQLIASRCDIPYKGKFKAENYQSMSKVVEKYA
ncbi:hypothetical protein ND926_16050 [Vibrio diabolicus]|uniref:hypothetical protein n=1 Tax=Vibrio diabolicus TaxID=50719 RepID=UPI00215EA412|nr:hypothetical protein [Vibrio diabolicus]MCS0338972.1 hypothetical protein [Vibrio diabolicus]MCS0433064.1 hypothetical protein [Vibrio diabolicus]